MTTKFTFNPFTGNFDIVTATLSPGDIVGGTPNTFAGFDATGALESLPSWGVNAVTTGANFNVSYAPADAAASVVVQNFVNTITPSNDLTQLNLFGLQHYSYLVGPNDIYRYQHLSNGISHSGGGAADSLIAMVNYMDLGDGTNVSVSNEAILGREYLNLNDNYTLSFTQGRNIDINVSAGANPGELSHLNLGGNVLGPSANIRVANMNMGLAGSTDNFVGLSDNTHLDSGSSANHVTGINIGFNGNTGSTIAQSYSGVNVAPQLQGTMTAANVNAVAIYPTIRTDASSVNGIAGNVFVTDSATITNGVVGSDVGVQMDNNTTANYLSGGSHNVNIGTNVTVPYVNAINANVQTNTDLQNVTLGQFSLGGSATPVNVTGINIDINALQAVNRKVAINANGGIINVNSSNRTQSSLGVDSLNTIVPTLTIPAGSPITGTSLIANNFSSLFDIQDDMAAGAIPGVALAGVGFVGQVQVASGKTLDALSWALSGSQISGDGTISSFVCYDAIGALPGGGTPIVSELYAFRGHSFLSAVNPGSLWGVSIEDSTAENFFEKSLAIGTASKKVTASGTGLELLNKDVVIDGGDQYITAMSTAGVVTNDSAGKLISVAPGTIGNVLTSTGSAWVSAPASGGGLTPVGTATVTASSNTTISGLDGNTDVAWKIVIRGTFTAPNGVPMVMQPNGDTTSSNYAGAGQFNYSLGTPISAGWSGGMEITRDGFGQPNDIWSILDFKCGTDGYARVMSGRTSIYDFVQPFGGFYDTGGGWNDLVNNITSIRFDFDPASLGATFTGTITIYRNPF